MNTAYNTTATTTVQDARNRYNALLAKALERIKARKTATPEEPEEITTAPAEEVTTPATQEQPEQVATPENVTTEYYGYLDSLDPMQAGRIKKQLDRRIYADGKICTWAEYIAEGYEAGQLKAYKDEYTYDKKGSDLAYHEHKVTEWVVWTAREMERGNGVLANKTIVDYALYLIKLMGTTAPEDTIPLDELVTAPDTAPQQPEEDTTTVPEEVATVETPVNETEEVTTEEATAPDTAPQQPEEDTTTAPATDDATLLRNLIEQYSNVGAEYLDALDYSKATKQEPRTVMLRRAKVTEKRYTMDNPQTYGLSRCYNRSGKRAMFTVYKDGQAIESRFYGENNKTYITGVRLDAGKLVYKVTDGLVTSAELTRDGKTTAIVFDDSNRPATPRDLPAPAPSKSTSKETAKEEPATTVQEQPTSKPAPTPEATTAPKEVQPVTTSKQEDGPAPYWLLLDNELRAQQEEQEQALATPEATKQEEPMHAPQMLKKIIEEKKKRASEGTNTTPLKTAVSMTTEVLTKKRAKELLGDDSSDYNTYILVDGKHVVRFDRPELSNTLYIADESKEYKEYQRGNISAVELYRNDAIRLNDPARILDTIKHGNQSLKVIDVKGDVLVFTEYGGYHGYRIATPDEVEICKAAAREASEAFTKRLDSYIRRYGKKIYVHSYWANR